MLEKQVPQNKQESDMAGKVSRREFVHWLGAASTGLMVAACSSAAPAAPTSAPKAAAPAAAPTTAPAAAAPASGAAAPPANDAMAAWDALVAAAKKEGKVVVNTFPGTGYRQALTVFEEKFPGITVEHTNMIAR